MGEGDESEQNGTQLLSSYIVVDAQEAKRYLRRCTFQVELGRSFPWQQDGNKNEYLHFTYV